MLAEKKAKMGALYMKKICLLFIASLFLIIPVCVKAESKIYFQNSEMSVKPGNTYKVNIKVDSGSSFKGVDFNIITLSEKIHLQISWKSQFRL